MVCALHRLFQKPEEDRIMEGDFDPAEERRRRDATAKPSPARPSRVVRLWKFLFFQEPTGLRRKEP